MIVRVDIDRGKMIKLCLFLVTIHGVLSAPWSPATGYQYPASRNFVEESQPLITLQRPKFSAESPNLSRGSVDSHSIIHKIPIPIEDLELARYEYNQGWLLQPLEQNTFDDTLTVAVDNPSPSILDVRIGSDASETGSGPYPPETESGPYPPEAESGPYPPEAESGPYPPEEESGPYPPEAESGPYPPEEESGPYPPEAESGPYPPEEESGPYPAEAESGPYPAEVESGPYRYEPQSGPGLNLGEKFSEIGGVESVSNGNTALFPPASLVPAVGSVNSGEEAFGSVVQSQFLESNRPETQIPLVIPTGTKIKVQDSHGQYSHGFANPDGTQVQETGHLISTDNGWEYVIAKEGSYSYLSPENIPIYVRYIADDKGYRIISQNFGRR